ncbi:glucan endo-1,3-beta-glucosidase-like [Cornus florida]|uniref:glucan endo-1,3-beta-glucosidase-like n=1 Tax=Cornus florida TaxID=4283 RepID=UPI002898FCD8|nr:glucan endo-1,3-beta-glucosidase-like [Cornus florida]
MEVSARKSPYSLIFLITTLVIQCFAAVHSIGVNYGTLADNLPPPAQVAQFIKDKTNIDAVKLFDANPDIIRAFANSGISVSITVPNGDIPGLTNIAGARQWIDTKVKPFYPATKINYILVGSEVLHWGDANMKNSLVPAMQTLSQALLQAGMKDVKISTPHSLGMLVPTPIPSASRFLPDVEKSIMAPMLEFLRKTKSGFMINPYPYFGYSPEKANYVLFKQNSGVRDPGTGLTYTNMYDQLLDSVHSAMKSIGYGDVEIVVGETGWPSAGEPWLTQNTPENARQHNLNILQKASSGQGTPLMPKRNFETYLFALFNENQKPGSISERNFGLFRPDFSSVYDIGVMGTRKAAPVNPAPETKPPAGRTPRNPRNPRKPRNPGNQSPRNPRNRKQAPGAAGKTWCVPKPGTDAQRLQWNIDYACGKVDCKPIQAGGPCFDPANAFSHASYAMNALYQSTGQKDCGFSGSGIVINVDPSKGACKYV